MVVFITGHTILRSDCWRDHLQEVELRRNLEQRTRIYRELMHLPHVAGHYADLELAGQVSRSRPFADMQ